MKNVLKIFALGLCLMTAFTAVGCGNGSNPDATAEPTAEPTPEPTPDNKVTWVKLEAESNEIYVAKLKPTVIGRCAKSASTYTFSYPSNGVEFGFTGTSLTIEIGDSNAGIAVYLDDMEEQYIKVAKKGVIEIAKGLDADKIHEVKILKRSEPNSGNLALKTIKIDEGAEYYVKSYEKPRKRIEVLGDSISCGYGNLYGIADGDDMDIEDGTQTFATMLAEHYNAEIDICAISGIGIGNKKNEPWPILPSYKMDGNKKHDFSNIPSLVIIEQGTNDDACGNRGDEFIAGAKELIDFIRSNYPETPIIWYYGIMGTTLFDQIESVVKYYNDNGDNNIYFLKTYQNSDEPQGGAGHPSVTTMARMKDELVAFIDANLGW